jgi:outer membrane cobalamin receptor
MQVTGSRISSHLAGSISHLDRTQIELINPVSTLDLLRRIPHVVVAENGVGGLSFVSMRGGESNFTLILVKLIQKLLNQSKFIVVGSAPSSEVKQLVV